MQPYFFPYIGYFQLIAAVDLFVVYDNIKYTKKGWINRNRMLQNGKDAVFSLPAQEATRTSSMCASESWRAGFRPRQLLNQIEAAYRRAPVLRARRSPLVEAIVRMKSEPVPLPATTRSADSASTSGSPRRSGRPPRSPSTMP